MERIGELLKAAASTPWAMRADRLGEVIQRLTRDAQQGKPTVQRRARAKVSLVRGAGLRGSIAVLPVRGVLTLRSSWYYGGTSYMEIASMFREAVASDDVAAIVLDIDSPGGMVSGCEELSQLIFSARGKKPVISVSNPQMASAAYYLGCAADETYVTPSGETGSIGVYTAHMDISAALEKCGVRVELISAGKYKVEGNPFEPLGDEARAAIQADVDTYYEMFVGAVARSRGVKSAAVRTGFGEGRCLPAAQAKSEQLVDGVATLDQVIANLAGGKGALTSRAMVFVPGARAFARKAEDAPTCPEDGSEMDWDEDAGEWVCPECGSSTEANNDDLDDEEQDSAPLDEDDSAALIGRIMGPGLGAGVPNHRVAVGGATTNGNHFPASNPAPAAERSSMKPNSAAAPAGPGTDPLATAMEIKTLAKSHGLTDERADELAFSGQSLDEARAAILSDLRTQHAQRPTFSSTAGSTVSVGADRELDKPFANLGEQLMAVKGATKNPTSADKRLLAINERASKRAAALGGNTQVPGEGGFALQDQFAEGIVQKVWETGQILQRVNTIPIGVGASALVRNVLKENSRKDGFRHGGVQVYRTAQASDVEASRQNYEQQRTQLEKLMGIFFATDEAQEDAVQLTAQAEQGFQNEMVFTLENEIVRGTGAGQCLGFTSAPNLLVVVPKETGQTAGTIVLQNVLNMLARLPARSYQSAVWLYNPICLPQLASMTLGTVPVFLPGGSAANAPFGSLLGIPLIPAEYCEPVGTQNDLLLTDLSQYTVIDKGGIKQVSSIHVEFLTAQEAFRWTYRVNGQPDWPSAVAPFRGTAKISPFVSLATRS